MSTRQTFTRQMCSIAGMRELVTVKETEAIMLRLTVLVAALFLVFGCGGATEPEGAVSSEPAATFEASPPESEPVESLGVGGDQGTGGSSAVWFTAGGPDDPAVRDRPSATGGSRNQGVGGAMIAAAPLSARVPVDGGADAAPEAGPDAAPEAATPLPAEASSPSPVPVAAVDAAAAPTKPTGDPRGPAPTCSGDPPRCVAECWVWPDGGVTCIPVWPKD